MHVIKCFRAKNQSQSFLELTKLMNGLLLSDCLCRLPKTLKFFCLRQIKHVLTMEMFVWPSSNLIEVESCSHDFKSSNETESEVFS